MYIFTFNPFRSSLFEIKGALFNANVPLHVQITQIRPSSTQLCLCTPNTLKLSPLQFYYALAPSNHSNHTSSTLMCPCTLKSFKSCPLQICLYTSIHSNHLQYPKISTIALNQLKLTFNCIKYAFKYYKYSMQYLQPPMLQISKHQFTPNMHHADLNYRYLFMELTVS